MKNLKSKIVEELDSIQHIANNIENRKDRESLKRSVKKIRKELKQVKNNDLLHSVSNPLPDHVVKFRLEELEIKYDYLMEQFNKINDC